MAWVDHGKCCGRRSTDTGMTVDQEMNTPYRGGLKATRTNPENLRDMPLARGDAGRCPEFHPGAQHRENEVEHAVP
jgi:hypothetical protein